MKSSLETVEKVMQECNQMLANMVQVSKNNLEAERLRLKNLEVTITKSDLKLKLESNSEEEYMIKRQKLVSDSNNFTALEDQIKIKESVDAIKEKHIENEFHTTKINVKREYKLTQKSSFDLWLDYLKSDLTNNDLLDIIDSNIRGPENISVSSSSKRKSIVRDVIINHLDEYYRKRILNESDPKEILKKLRGYKKSEINVTHTSVRARLYQIKMRKEEKVDDFCERFDSIIREYEACENAVPLTDQEKRSSFYQAVSSIAPELRNADFIQRQNFSKEMSLEEIKSFLLQLEAEKKSEKKEEIRVQMSRTFQNQGQETRCHRCNSIGHWAKECHLQNCGQWFCYYCQK